MMRAIACPCAGPKASVCKISRSRVPCSSSSWLSRSPVVIRPEDSPVQVEYQGESRAKVSVKSPMHAPTHDSGWGSQGMQLRRFWTDYRQTGSYSESEGSL